MRMLLWRCWLTLQMQEENKIQFVCCFVASAPKGRGGTLNFANVDASNRSLCSVGRGRAAFRPFSRGSGALETARLASSASQPESGRGLPPLNSVVVPLSLVVMAIRFVGPYVRSRMHRS